MPKILLAGEDVPLLGTRVAVLARTGAEVISCLGPQAVRMVKSERPDLVVLCHSLLDGKAAIIADETRMCCGTTKILMVLSQAGSELPFEESKFNATCLSNPERLLACVSEMLGGTPGRPAQTRDRHESATPARSLGGEYQV